MRPRPGVFLPVLVAVLLVLHGVPWWRLVLAPQWPAPVTIAGTVVAVVALVGFPLAMWQGHGHGKDGLAIVGDSWLGVVWQLFAWTVLSLVADLVLALAGVADPGRSRWVAVVVLVGVAVLLVWGCGGAAGPQGPPRRGHRAAARRRPGRPAAGADRRHPLRPDRPVPLVGRSGGTGQRAPAGRTRARRRPRRRLGRPAPRSGRPARRRGGATWPGSTSPATTSTCPAPPTGWPTWPSSAGRCCTTGIWWSNAAAAGSSSPASTTAPRGIRGAGPRRRPRGRPRRPRPRRAGAAAGAPAEVGPARRAGRRRSAGLRAHPRRPDVAVPLPGPADQGACRVFPATATARSSTPAAVPGSGARRSASSRRARSLC